MEDAETSNLNYNILYCLYLPLALYYCLQLANDSLSNLLLLAALMTLTSVFRDHQRKLLFLQATITAADAVLKGLLQTGAVDIGNSVFLDGRIINNILSISEEGLNASSLVYVGMVVVSWALPFVYRGAEQESSQRTEYYLFLKSISNLLDFITPLLIYALGFTKLSSISFREWLEELGPQQHLSNFDMFEQVSWSLITALFLLLHRRKQQLRKGLTLFILALIIRDHHVKIYYPELSLYNLEPFYVNAIKIAIVLFFRIHNQTAHVQDGQEEEPGDGESSRMSSYKKYTLKRRLTMRADRNHLLVILLLLLTIVTLVLTNGLGNLVAIVGVFLNVPGYQERSFRRLVGLGVTASFLLQPNQFIYFVFLYVARYVPTSDHAFEKRNWWVFLEVGRVMILLSKVSVLNFLIGLFESQLLVVLALMFRTACSFFSFILVFFGTEDNYEYYVQYFVPSSLGTDILLWAYLMLLRTYSPSSTVKFAGTDITNIFEEYSVIRYLERGLKVLKVFHWIAYIAISLMILKSDPCLFTLTKIVPLLLAIVVGIVESHRSELSQKIWLWNFYTSFSIAFVKYFFLLSKYDNLSPWLIALLRPLQQYREWIGLSPPDHSYLWISFGPDFLVILINAVVLFLFKIELSEANYLRQRERILQEAHLEARLLPPEEDDQQQKSIHYLYNNYVKPVEFKFKEASRLRPFLTDFIFDLFFCCFLLVFYLLPSETYSVAILGEFLLFFLGYFLQNGKHNYQRVFFLLILVSSLDLLCLYIQYFIETTEQPQEHHSLSMLAKYLVLVISIVFNETNNALLKFYNENLIVKKSEHSFLIFRLLAPTIPNEKLRKEVLVLYVHLFKILTAAAYLTTLAFGEQKLRYIHLGGLLLMAAVALVTNAKAFYKQNWIYCVLAVSLGALWQGYLHSFFILCSVRLYYMLIEEFSLQVFMEKYGITNKTSNEDMKRRVEEVENKFQLEDRLEVISEVKEIRENTSYLSFNEDQVVWKDQNTYCTVVWVMPIFALLLILLGVLFYQPGLIGFSLFILCLVAILYCLAYFEQWSISSLFTERVTIAIALVFAYSVADYFLLSYLTVPSQSAWSSIGMFFIAFGLLLYYYLWRHKDCKRVNREHQYSYHIDFSFKRSQEAISYWRKKCEMVSELGSQIHNQKKMASLKQLFLHKENLGMKVEHLSQELKEKCSHRKSRFQNLQKIEGLEDQDTVFKKQQFEVFSNMLTFMSIEDLQYCYLHLNQYCKVEFGVDCDLTRTISDLKEWVITHYENSLSDTLRKWEHARYAALTSEEKFANLEKIEEEIQRADEEAADSKEEIVVERNLSEKLRESLNNGKKEENLEAYDQLMDSFSRRAKEEAGVKDFCSERIDMRLGELSWFTRKVVQNIEIIGLIITAGWNFFGGVYTIPTNIAIFAWAIVLQTKTTVFFWMFLLLYSSVILSCKLLLVYLPKHFFINFLFYYHPNDYFYEFIMISACVVEIVFLKFGGTAELAYSQRESIYDAFYRTLLNQAARGSKKHNQAQFLSVYSRLRCSTKHSFLHRVFSKGRLKPGKDLYPLLAMVQVVILLYIFFFYDMMEFQSKNNRKSLGEILTVTQFSKNMILALFFQALIMVADRIIVSLNLIDALNQKLENFLVSTAFANDPKYESLSEEELVRLGRFDYLLIIKYVFHLLLLIAINFFVYFYIPSGGLNKSIIPECENTVCGKSYTFLSIFLMLYLIYFVISGLQIKHGFNRNKCRNTLMERYDWVDYYIYMCFTGIPFLWEFKKISDWTITATALPLFHWMKFEDINARMYQSKCESEILRIKPLGKGPWYKYFMGPPGFLFILGLVFSPIIMYSSFNPFAVQDNIIAASFKFQLTMDKHIFYNFFETSHTTIISDQSFEGYNKKILGLFDRANLYKIEASSYPDQVFMLSEPAVLQLSQHIRKTYLREANHQFQLKLMASVTQKQGGESTIEWGSKILSTRQLQNLQRVIHSNNQTLQITNFYSPLPGQLNNQTIFLTNQNEGEYFELKTTRIRRETDGSILPRKGLFIFYKSSVKYKVAIGLLTFYLTYVVLINSLFRMYLTGGLENIIFEGCELQKILFICEAVRSARILQNFYQEEYLYFSLVDLMRYPRMIKNIADDFCNLRQPQQQKQLKIE